MILFAYFKLECVLFVITSTSNMMLMTNVILWLVTTVHNQFSHALSVADLWRLFCLYGWTHTQMTFGSLPSILLCHCWFNSPSATHLTMIWRRKRVTSSQYFVIVIAQSVSVLA